MSFISRLTALTAIAVFALPSYSFADFRASEAKQSRSIVNTLDCFVASALAMTI
jgi:hypothetical protein